MPVRTTSVNEGFTKIFAIEPDSALAVHPADEVPAGAIVFSNQAELAAVSANWPAKRLVDIWNKLPGATTLNRFTSHQTAVRRIWAAVSERNQRIVQENLDPQNTGQPPTAMNRKHSQNHAGSKRETIIALLRQPEGATLKAIMMATNWQAHSVRGFISGQLTKRSHFKVKSFQRDGERVYRIRS
jgi:hypothetical protein